MKKIRGIFWVVASALLAAYGASAAAQVAEVEPNYPLTSAQPLTLEANLTATANAFLDSGDVDVFSFQAKKGDKLTIDIDGGAPYIDTIVVLLGPGPSGPYEAKTGNDDSELVPVDSGSLDQTDSYIGGIVPYEVGFDGVYYIAVSHWGTEVIDNGVIRGGGGNPTGSYTVILSISRQVADTSGDTQGGTQEGGTEGGGTQDTEAPAAQPVTIDIRPGQPAETAIIHRSRARIPVAILSSDNFDAMQVDTSSLTFGHSGDEQSLEKCHPQGVDVNRDGRRDMVCVFNVKAANFELNDMTGLLKGKTKADTRFQGEGLLKVVELRKSGQRRHGHDVRDDRRRDRDDRDDHDRRKRR
jgi:hypothetical protein